MARQVIIKNKIVRGIRESVPSGFVLARLSPGEGPVELVSIDALSITQKATGLFPSGSVSSAYDLGMFIASSSALYQAQYYPFTAASTAISLLSATGTPVAQCLVAPTTSTAKFYVTADLADFQANEAAGAYTICSITFAAASLTGVVTPINTNVLARGGICYLVVDFAWVETTMAEIQILLPGDPA